MQWHLSGEQMQELVPVSGKVSRDDSREPENSEFLTCSYLEKKEGDGAQKDKSPRHPHKGLVILPRELKCLQGFRYVYRKFGDLCMLRAPHPYKAKLLILHFLKVLPELSQINSLSALVMVFQFGKREIHCV